MLNPEKFFAVGYSFYDYFPRDKNKTKHMLTFHFLNLAIGHFSIY